MKTLLLFAICLLSFTICKAQRVSYNDLIFVLNHDVDATEDYLSNKGFEFSKVDTLTNTAHSSRRIINGYDFGKVDTLEQISYIFTKNSSHDKWYISVEKKSIKEIFYEVSMYTTFQADYLAIKAFIKKLGYKPLNTKVNNGDLVTTYKKGFMEISFMLTHDEKLDFTTYYISITDTDKEKAAWKLSE